MEKEINQLCALKSGRKKSHLITPARKNIVTAFVPSKFEYMLQLRGMDSEVYEKLDKVLNASKTRTVVVTAPKIIKRSIAALWNFRLQGTPVENGKKTNETTRTSYWRNRNDGGICANVGRDDVTRRNLYELRRRAYESAGRKMDPGRNDSWRAKATRCYKNDQKPVSITANFHAHQSRLATHFWSIPHRRIL